MFERVTVGTLLQVEREIHRLVNPMKLIDFNDRRAADDPYMRQKLAQLHIECQAIRHGSLRRMTRRLRRLPRGPEGLDGQDVVVRTILHHPKLDRAMSSGRYDRPSA